MTMREVEDKIIIIENAINRKITSEEYQELISLMEENKIERE